MSSNMGRGKRYSKPRQNKHDLEKEMKGKNSASKVVRKIPMKILTRSTTQQILIAFPEAFPTEIKPCKCPAEEIEGEARKATEDGKGESKRY